MRRYFMVAVLAGLFSVGAAAWLWHPDRETAQKLVARQGPGENPGPNLPLSQVVLFSSGVGYFQREGEVEGNARVDLQFPIGDVNDLLKSLVLQDLGKGKVGAISYDGQDPVEKTLRSFAVDLTGNPTFGQVLNQARGEKVEVIMQQTAAGQPGTITGVVLGMESQTQPVGPSSVHELHMLNLVCAEGMRSVKLSEIQRIRFLNAKLDGELKRALEVLSASHDAQKKLVSLNFKGDGKRKVRVGYVAENPIWKTSYRLSLDKASTLQGWAAVENVTDEDWSDVRVVLVSGRPISFQMDLYPPIYVPRPTVEPERFASLRPPTYNGAMIYDRMAGAGVLGAGGGLVGIGGGGNNLGAGQANNLGAAGFGGFGGQQGQTGNLGGQFGQQGGNRYQGNYNPMINAQRATNADDESPVLPGNNRLTYEQLQVRRKQQNEVNGKNVDQAKKLGAKIADQKLDPHQSIASVAASEEIGDAFRYIIEDRVSLPRQKSALLPLLDKGVAAARVSIFNEAVHGKYPLLGLRFKNNTGQPLTQGPVTVYEDSSYAGDARLPDMQPDEERLISYAVDLGSEVKTNDRFTPGPAMALRTSNDAMNVRYTVRRTRTYAIRNRSKQDRVMVIEHPETSDWKLAKDQKPRETSRDVYRFDVPVKAGSSLDFEVAEERVRIDPFRAQFATKRSPGISEARFATNLDLEVDEIVRVPQDDLLAVKIVAGELRATTKHTRIASYRLLNRAKEDRTVTVEHQVPGEWKLVGDAKPVEDSVGLYRFPLAVKAGAAAVKELTEEFVQTTSERLASMSEERLQGYIADAAVAAKVKDALVKFSEQKAGLAETVRQIEEINKQLKEISDDQSRLRQNLEKVPKESEAHKRYVKKFDDQETRIEKLQEQLKEKETVKKRQEKDLESAGKRLSAE